MDDIMGKLKALKDNIDMLREFFMDHNTKIESLRQYTHELDKRMDQAGLPLLKDPDEECDDG